MANQVKDISTGEVNEEVAKVKNSKEISDIISGMAKFDSLFLEDVGYFMDQKGISRQKMALIVSSVMSPQHLYNLLNGNRQPNNREYVIAIGLALGLSIDEMNILLKDSGHRGLDAKRSTGDIVVIYGISHRKDLNDINEMLHRHHADYDLYSLDAN